MEMALESMGNKTRKVPREKGKSKRKRSKDEVGDEGEAGSPEVEILSPESLNEDLGLTGGIGDFKDKNESKDSECSCACESKKRGVGQKKVKKKRKIVSDDDLVISNDLGSADELKKEELTEMLNDVGSGKLQKLKKTKSKGRKASKTVHEIAVVNEEEDEPIDKKERNLMKDDTEVQYEGSMVGPAVEYLIQWKKDRSNWTFKKLRQVWLLKNMYDKTKLSSKHFKILMNYMKDLKGKAREGALAKAKEIMETEDEDGIIDNEKALQRVRAEKIVKLLS